MAGGRARSSERLPGLPEAPIDRLTRPWQRFTAIEAASGLVLMACSLAAIVLANSSMAGAWAEVWETRVVAGFGTLVLDYPLWYWINDGLMALFFFVVGLEIKRELVHGELREPARVVLPVSAAIGGAVIPVAFFWALHGGQPGSEAWAVPMATDIAFVVGILALLGDRVPNSLKVFLLSLAIADDLIAVGVIAVFLGEAPKLTWLAAGGVLLLAVASLNRLGVRRVAVYAFVGTGAWICTLKSGIHPTVAGAILGLMTPAGAWLARSCARDQIAAALEVLDDPDVPEGEWEERLAMDQTLVATLEARSPLERLEIALHPWVAFMVMPIFALANAGVAVDAAVMTSPLTISIGLALVIGKPVGILLACGAVVGAKLAPLPTGVRWPVLAAASCLAGVGFTMSLFVAGLSLPGSPELLAATKAGVLAGSLISGLVGYFGLRILLSRGDSDTAE